MNRRKSIEALIASGLGLGVLDQLDGCSELPNAIESTINHSVCKWCYSDIPLEQFAEHCKDLQIGSIELLNPDEWDTVLNKGLTCAISNGSPLGITKGFNDPKLHSQLKQDYMPIIARAADKGIKQIICFSGNRNGLADDIGLDNCARGLESIVKEAERQGITIVMELLNSKIDHHDYMCDHTTWGVQLVEKLASPNFKLLYDIYHMQIMEGDVIRTISDHKNYISHFHTGGVPGRNEIDDTQELNYKAVVNAIQETGFTGFIAQEFIPTRTDVLSSLKQGVEICTV